MSLEQQLSPLKENLSTVYAESDDIRRIVDDSGLRRADYNWNQKGNLIWKEVLYQAVIDGKLKDILNVCLKEFADTQNASLYESYLNRIVSLPDLLTDEDSFIDVINKLRQNLNSTTIDDIRKNIWIKIYSLTSEITDGELTESLKQTRSLPFLGEKSYTLKDADIFFGYRNEKINSILDKITLDKKNLVLMQKHGIGKTSFINACLIPALFRRNKNYLIIIVGNYVAPLDQIKKYVKSLPTKFAQNFIYENPENDRPVIIIFDQLDCSVSDDERELFFKDLKTLAQSDVQIIVVCRDDDDQTESKLYNADENFEFEKDFFGFDTNRAKRIIEDLLDRGLITRLCDSDVIEKIADNCTDADNGKVSLQLLQIVCKEIFEKAKQNGSVSKEDYEERKLFKNAVLKHLELKISKLEDIGGKDIAWQILASFDNFQGYQTLDKINVKSAGDEEKIPKEKISAILGDLQKFGVIVKKRKEGKYQFSPAISIFSSVAAEQIVSGQFSETLATAEVNNAFSTFKNNNDILPSTVQLRDFYKYRDKLRLNSVQTLFILRSAVENIEPVDYWLDLLRRNNGRELVKELQKFDGSEAGLQNLVFDDFKSAIKLFGETAIQNPDNQNWLTRKAVSDKDREIRQTAVLAMTLEDNFDLKNIIKPETCKGVWQRIKRKNELSGTLLDALPRNKTKELKISTVDLITAWFWRTKRRFQISEVSTARFLLYSGITGGIILSIFRADMAMNFKAPTNAIGDLFSKSIVFWLFIMAGAFSVITVVFSMLLAKHLLLNPIKSLRINFNDSTGKMNRQTLTNLLIILSVIISFGMLNTIYLATLNSVSFLSVILGGLPGLGLGLALLVNSKNAGKYENSENHPVNDSGAESANKWITAIFGGFITVLFFCLTQIIYINFCEDSRIFFTESDSYVWSVVNAAIVGLMFYLSILLGNLMVGTEFEKDLLFE